MRKTLKFILLQLIWICLLVGGLMLYHNSLSSEDSHPTTITIVSGNPQDGTLVLKPADDPVPVCRGRQVTWAIDPSSNVDTFRIEKKNESEQIFAIGFYPSSRRTKHTWGTVGITGRKGKPYNYTIYWKMKGETGERRFDPKLAIKSTSIALMEWLIYIVYAVLFLFSFRVFRTAKK